MSHEQLLLQFNDVASSAARNMHRIGRSLQLSFCFGVSAPTSPFSFSLLGYGRQFRGLHDVYGKFGFHAIHTAICERVNRELLFIRFGYLMSKLGIVGLVAWLKTFNGGCKKNDLWV